MARRKPLPVPPAPEPAANLAGLVQACKDEPDDDGLRGVLADYLEDHGETVRAEFLRASLLLPPGNHNPAGHAAVHVRLGPLLRDHGDAWTGPLRDLSGRVIFDRGFLAVSCGIEDLRSPRDLDRLAAVAPWTERLLLGFGQQRIAVEFVRSEAARYFTRLNLSRMSLDRKAMQAVAQAEAAPGWRELVVTARAGSPGAALPLFAADSRLTGLQSLSLDGPLSVNEMRALTRAPFASRLRHLAISGASLTSGHFHQLIAGEGLPRLQSLRITGVPLSAAGVQALTEVRHWAALTELRLPFCRVADDLVALLAEWPLLARLRHLDLSRNPIGHEGGIALARSPHLENLEVLEVDNTALQDASLLALTQGPGLARLQTLALGGIPLGSGEGFRALCSGRCFPRLSDLDVNWCRLGSTELQTLLEGPPAPRLRRLNLGGNNINDAAAEMLARSPALANLEALQLGSCPIDARGFQAIAKSHTLSRLLWLSHISLESAALGLLTLARDEGLPALAFLDLGLPPRLETLTAFAESPRRKRFFALRCPSHEGSAVYRELHRGFPRSRLW